MDLREEREDEGIPLPSRHEAAVAGIQPARASTSVDLPNPLAPMTANSSPSHASLEMLLRRVLVLVGRLRGGISGGAWGREEMGAQC